MSTALGRRVLSQFFLKNGTKSRVQVFAARWWSTVAEEKAEAVKPARNLIPAPEPGRIQAAVLKGFSSPFQIENVEIPKLLAPSEVLIDVHYCALNGTDILLRENSYVFEPKLPTVLGYEIAGKILELGADAAKAGYKVGDKVVALNHERLGGFSETCTAELGDIWKVPSSTKLSDAVCLLDGYATALIGLEKRAGIQEDDLILINVGLGGVGLAAVDIAANIFRAKVIAVCATEDRATLVREKGAFAAFKHQDKTLMKQITNVAKEKNIIAIFDGVSGENFKKLLACFTDVYKSGSVKDLLIDSKFSVVVQHLSREGRIIVAGLASTKFKPDDSTDSGSFSVTGISLQEYRRKNHELYRSAGEEVLEFFDEGIISPTRSLVAGLYKINEAAQFITEMKTSGKVIIDLKNKETFPESTG